MGGILLPTNLRFDNDTSGWGSTPKHLSKILTAEQNYSKFLDLSFRMGGILLPTNLNSFANDNN